MPVSKKPRHRTRSGRSGLGPAAPRPYKGRRQPVAPGQGSGRRKQRDARQAATIRRRRRIGGAVLFIILVVLIVLWLMSVDGPKDFGMLWPRG